MGVKQGCPLSPTLFGIYIDELEELIAENIKHAGLEGPSLGIYMVLILLYADDVILMAHSHAGMSRLLELLKTFCDKSGLKVNVAKTKMLSCSTIPNQIFEYEGSFIEHVTEFKYLGIEIPSTYKWSKCMDRRLAAAKRMYYMLETVCNHKDIHNWKIRCILFEAYVMQTMLYGVELWGGSISATMWDEVEKLQKRFIRQYVGVRITTPYSLLLLEAGCLPIEYYGLIRVLKYIQKVKGMPNDRLPRQAWEICKTPKKNYKSKFLASGWMLDIRKWFKSWNLEKYLEQEEIDWEQMEKDFKTSLWQKWAENAKHKKFEYYCEKIMRYNKEAFINAKGTRQAYFTTPMTWSQRSNLAKIRMRSHSLEIEKGAWAGIPRSARCCTLCINSKVIEDEAHVLLQCPTYAHIRAKYEELMKQEDDIYSLLNKANQKTLGRYITEVLTHREHLLATKK